MSINDVFTDLKKYIERHRELYGHEVVVEYSNIPKTSGLAAESKPQEITPMKSSAVRNDALPTLDELKATVSGCKKCDLCKTRTQTVFGSGNPKANLMFVGEAPGADEDEQGLPFVGRAGQLLTKMIEEERSLGIPRETVYIANILKCRPPGNRKPNPNEIEQCEPYLITQIELIRPKIICALGLTAANTLLRNTLSMTAMRGKTFDYHGVPLIVTYHPAALLRNPNWKKPAWEDMLLLKKMLEDLKKN